jgi:hypothetical protein
MNDDSQEARRNAVAALPNDVQIGGFGLPTGKHHLLVAEKNAFAMINITRKSDGQQFVFPLVAGTITLEDGSGKITVEISGRPGYKTLVLPIDHYVEMQCNASYNIIIEERNGKKIVTSVTPFEDMEED